MDSAPNLSESVSGALRAPPPKIRGGLFRNWQGLGQVPSGVGVPLGLEKPPAKGARHCFEQERDCEQTAAYTSTPALTG